MRYKIMMGNEYITSRYLTATELDSTLNMLSDVFEDRVYVNVEYHNGE
jgi:hypothetical protein